MNFIKRPILDKQQVIAHFKRMANKDSFLGNYFVDLAAVGDSALCQYLRELQREKGWLDDPSNLWGRWASVVCTYLECGTDGLLRVAKADSQHESIGMCLCILATKRSSERLALMAKILPLKFRLPTNANSFETQYCWCREIIEFLTLGEPLETDSATASRLRRFAHAFLEKGLHKVEKRKTKSARSSGSFFYFGPGLELLSFVGDQGSIEFIRELSRRSEAVRSMSESVIEKINKRHIQP